MIGRILTLLLLCCAASTLRAQIDVYFNHEVDTSLAWPRGNLARGGVDFAAIASAEINAAKRSVDMAMYSFNSQPVLDALLGAHARAVRVRVIAHQTSIGSSSNRFQALIAAGIPVIANPEAPDSQPQPLMHSKFFVIDDRTGISDSAQALRPTVVTGSWNATDAQTTVDYNNLVVIRDSAVTGAYAAEFEEMWGGSGPLPDTAHSRFGADKLGDTDTLFTLSDGTRLEVRFSPSDHASRGINTALASGEHAVYTANLVFTYEQFANTLRRQHNNVGTEVRSIIDQNTTGNQYDTLRTFADALMWNAKGMFHHKYAVIDPAPICIDNNPRVVTGSHNWSLSAEIRNDENMLVVNNAAIANQYLQEFAARYRDAGGVAPFISTVGVEEITDSSLQLRAASNPFDGTLTLMVEGLESIGDLRLYSTAGDELARFELSSGASISRINTALPSGLYLLRLTSGSEARTLKIVLGR